MMHSISIITTAIVGILSSNAMAQEYSGNLALCLPNNSGAKEQSCLSGDGALTPTAISEVPRAFRFNYTNGLLRTGDSGFCLGPTVPVLSTKAGEMYSLFPQECPEDDNDNDEETDPTREDASWDLSHSRHMRFLVTRGGRVQSLAAVRNPDTGADEASTHPFCLTITKRESDPFELAYLVPCDEEPFETETIDDEGENSGESVETQQVFDVYGTYSGSFVMPLHCVYSSTESVELAYQVGLPSTEATDSSTDANFIEITTFWPITGQGVEQHVLDVIPLETPSSGGILSLEPFGSNLDFSLDGFSYQMDGKLTATLRSTQGGQDDGMVLSEASFWISRKTNGYTKPPASSYLMFVYMLGLFVACFVLSVTLEKVCLKRTRADGPGSSDGKTVCMSTEEDEEDDFPLEDNVEEGFGVIHICVEKDTDGTSSDTDTDIDESRNSRTIPIPTENEV